MAISNDDAPVQLAVVILRIRLLSAIPAHVIYEFELYLVVGHGPQQVESPIWVRPHLVGGAHGRFYFGFRFSKHASEPVESTLQQVTRQDMNVEKSGDG